MHFNNISVEDGLTQSTVYAVFQDRDGFMWFGTRDGLNRYDGITIKTYRTSPGQPFTLSHPNIRAILQDDSGMIWLGTDGGGLNMLDPRTGRFYKYPFHTGEDPGSTDGQNPELLINQILSLAIDNDGMIWVGHRHHGVSLFDPDSKAFQRFAPPGTSDGNTPDGSVWALEVDSDGGIWLGTEQGLWHHVGSGRFRLVLSDVPVWDIHADDDGFLWVATTSGGMMLIDPVTSEILPLPAKNPVIESLRTGSTGPVMVGNDGTVWIAHADLGLFVWDRNKNEVRHLHAGYDYDYTIRDNSVRSIYKDRSGMIWIGTNSSGVYSYSPARKKFEQFPSSDRHRQVFSPPVTLSFTEAPDGRIWIGTETAGVFLFDRMRNNFEALPYDPEDPAQLNHHQIITLLTDRNGAIWIGTDGGGLEQWSADGTKTGHFLHNSQDTTSISNNSILFLYEDRSGRLWVGTYRGLNMKNPESHEFVRFGRESQGGRAALSDDRILSISEDRNGLIWIGTHGGGLNRLDPESGDIRSFTPHDETPTAISSDRVNAIVEDDAGRLWLGTYHGLNMFDPVTETFTQYTESDGLSSNIIRGIIRTGGDLWLSTNSGLTRFGIRSKSIVNYSESDGLQSREFKGGAYYKSRSGEMYFGGINGFNVFRPDKLPVNTNVPPVVLTSFRVSGEDREIADGEVSLRHFENFFSIHFAALDFVSPAENRYRYKLFGFDPGWVDAGNLSEARYTRVPPGKYIFSVMAANNDGVWNTTGAKLFISVSPPFWSTWWFVMLVLMSAVLALYVTMRTRVRLRQREERLRQKIARNLHDDISGSLSSIDLFATAIERENSGTGKSGKYLNLITESAREAKDKISEIVWYVDPRYDDWQSFANHLNSYANTMFEAASIDFRGRINKLPKSPMGLELRQNLWLMVKELLINAIRHSRAKEVSIDMQSNQKSVTITIADNGIGFDSQAVREGNGIDNIFERCQNISANVKLESSPGGGTLWVITVNH